MDVTVFNINQNVMVALLVIGGYFGNGEDRKVKLKKAGYEPELIQACVNDLLPILKKYGGA